MRPSSLLLLSGMLLLPARVASQDALPSALAGRWTGSGTFFDRTLDAKAGPVLFIVEIKPDGSLHGELGKAMLREVRVRASRELTEVTARLEGAVGADPALAKDRVVLLITKHDSTTIEVEFHLKSNFLFDPWMREGRVTLKRAPRSASSTDVRATTEAESGWMSRCAPWSPTTEAQRGGDPRTGLPSAKQ